MVGNPWGGSELYQLAPLAQLPPIRSASAQHTYHPFFMSTGPDPGTGDGGGGGDPNWGGGGPVIWGPPGGPGGDPCTLYGVGCDGGGGGTGGGGGGTGGTGTGTSTGSGCNIILNPWPCILRIIIIILGIIAVIGGIYLLKPAVVDKPIKLATKAVKGAAMAA